MADAALTGVWEEFCRKLAEAGTVLSDPQAPKGGVDQADALRYLSRLTRAATEMYVESADPDFPRFFQLSNETVKIGADNPDNIYLNSLVRGDREYVIRGNKADVDYLSFGSKANRYHIDGTMASTGEIEGSDMKFGADGSYEIIASAKPQPGNWLKLEADSTMIIARQTFYDWAGKKKPTNVTIQRLNGPKYPKPLDPDTIRQALDATAAWVKGTANTFAEWQKVYMATPNQLLDWGQEKCQRGGGDPLIHYLFAYWKLAPDEAWVIDTEIPDCRYWNYQHNNWWMESLNYVDHKTTYNHHSARLNPDGTLTLVVAHQDPGPGVLNWVDTAGHSNGNALLRWVGATRFPVPTCKVVKFADLQR